MSGQTKQVKVFVRAILEYTRFVGESEAEYVDGCAPNCHQIRLMQDMIECCDADIVGIAAPISVVCLRVLDYLASVSPRNTKLKAELDLCREVRDSLKLRGCDQIYVAISALETATKKYDNAIDDIAETISDEFLRNIDAIRGARRELSLLLIQ